MVHFWDGKQIMLIPKTVQVFHLRSNITGNGANSTACGCRGFSKQVALYFTIGFLCGLVLYGFMRIPERIATCRITKKTLKDPQFKLKNNSLTFKAIEDLKNGWGSFSFVENVEKFLLPQKYLETMDKQGGVMNEEKEKNLGRNNFLFIGIMTARKYLDNRAKASFLTWVPQVPGKVVYFLGEGEEYTGDLDVVILDGVTEDAYPPQKKSFAMIEYISQHFAQDYEWVMRADDDVYVRVDELVTFLTSIDAQAHRYIGQPGFGKHVEKGKLGLAGAFCMGGPGVIMSSGLVQAVSPSLENCLTDTASGHEDTELGRCITIATGVQCSVNFQMRRLFYQNYEELNLTQSSFKKQLGKDELQAITLHPVKDSAYVFRMHNFFNGYKLKTLEKKKRELLEQIRHLDLDLDRDVKNRFLTEIRESALPYNIRETQNYTESHDYPDPYNYEVDITNLDEIELLPRGQAVPGAHESAWELIRDSRLYSPRIGMGKLEYSTKHRRRHRLQLKLIRAMTQMGLLNSPNRTLDNISYHRLTSHVGVEAMMYVRQEAVSRGSEIEPFYVRRRLQSQRHLLDFREGEEIEGHNKDIYILLAIYQRSKIYRRFLETYKKVVEGYQGNVYLRVVVFIDKMGEYRTISAMTATMLATNRNLKIQMIFLEGPFNRGRGLMEGQKGIHSSSLLLFMDVDMEMTSRFLYRVARNTVLGKTAFFPIYFVNYMPSSVCFERSDCAALLNSRDGQAGLWRSFSYGIASIYQKDLIRIGGFKQDIVGWGLEDVDVYEKCLTHGLTIIRASDPGLLHRYHPRECDPNLPLVQLTQCRDSSDTMLGSVKTLFKMLEKYEYRMTGR